MSSARVPFVIGVTGKMKIPGYQHQPAAWAELAPAVQQIYDRVFAIFDWITQAPARTQPGELGTPGGSKRRSETPVVVLTSLAPGADTIVAEAALDYAKTLADGDLLVRAPLPFEPHLYRDSTSFREEADSSLPSSSEQLRFDQVLQRVRGQPGFEPDRDLFGVALHAEHRNRDPALDLRDKAGRNLRYRAAGEYIATSSHLLIAVCRECPLEGPTDPHEREQLYDIQKPGTASIVHAKREGLSFNLLATPNGFAWADNGPVLHLPICEGGDGQFGCDRNLRWLHPFDLRPGERSDPDIGTEICAALGLGTRHGIRERKKSRERAKRAASGAIAGDNAPPTKPAVSKAKRIWEAVVGKTLRVPERADPQDPDDLGADSGASSGHAPGSSIQDQLAKRWHFEGMRHFGPALRYLHRLQRLPENTEEENRSVAKRFLASSDEASRSPEIAAIGTLADPIERLRSRASERSKELTTNRNGLVRALFWLTLIAAASLGIYEHWSPQDAAGKQSDHHSWFAHDGKSLIHSALLFISLAALVRIGWLFFHYKKSDAERDRYGLRAFAEGLRVQHAWILAGVPATVSAEYMQRQRSELDWIRHAIQAVTWPAHRYAEAYARLSDPQRWSLLEAVRRSFVEDQWKFFRTNSSRAEGERHFFHLWGWSLAAAGVLNIAGKFLAALSPRIHGAIEHHSLAIAISALGLGCGILIATALWIRHQLKRDHAAHHDDTEPPTKFLVWLFNRPAQWGWALVLGSMPLLLSCPLSRCGAWSPAHHSWWLITTGLLILIGALLLTLSERNFYAEDARRYRAMESLFASANRRLERIIAAYSVNPSPTRLAEIHDILHQLGREALAEHAEWLILHRIHPLEPFMAG